MKVLLGMVIFALPAIAGAQSRACTDSTVHFEFQMSQPARWLADTTATVHPTAAIRDPANLIQFVVDTLGVPQARTFRALRVTDSILVAAAQQELAFWRYAPGLLNGCRARQLVQTPIGR